MKYSTYKNPLCDRYRGILRDIKKTGVEIYPEWTTWRGFAEWLERRGHDETYRFSYSPFNPFTPEYLGTTKRADPPFEYIAYEATDPYELIICSAPSAEELSEKLIRMGYNYTTDSIWSALSRNEERAVEDRLFGLIFEKIDLRNYDETDEPFEERD